MRVLLLVLALASTTACDKLRKTGVVAGGATASIAPDSMKVDKVKSEGGPIGTDGTKDAAVSLTVDGPVTGIVMVTTDKDGKPQGSQQWDTYNEGDAIPPAIGAEWKDGGPTWQLGVFEGGKMKNAANGSLTPLAAGPHQLVLYASDSGFFTKEYSFAIFVERPDHSIVRSNVFTF